MAATSTFTCICGVQKKTSNHWILAICTSHDLRFVPWDWNLAHDDSVIVLCGERCAAGLLSRSLGEWKQAEFLPVAHLHASESACMQPSYATELRDRLYTHDGIDRD